MEFWNNKVNVSKEAATLQIQIIKSFSPEKRMKIALDFSNMGISRTREWIQKNNPNYSELEVTLAFVRLMYFETGQMTAETWDFYKSEMEKKIREDWKERFRIMMKENHWTYDDVAQMGGFKNGEVIKATISRGLPSFAKLAVMVYERLNNSRLPIIE
jgi:hypothetical protein